MKERTMVSFCALLTSLAAYRLARAAKKDATPYLLIGGFSGALIGEMIIAGYKKKKENAVANNK
jgi:hypothetical protein